MYSDIKNAIKAHITAVTGIKSVYGYEKGNLNGYPAATVTLQAIACEYETNTEDQRKYTFKVKIYQELENDAEGAETAEATLEALLDTVIGKIEDDWDLGGLCHKVNINGVAGYVDRGVNMRVLEFNIDCYALYSLS